MNTPANITEANPHNQYHLISLFEFNQVPKVCSESFAITAYPASKKPNMGKYSIIYINICLSNNIYRLI